MTYEEYNAFCASLPQTTHVVQWNEAHVWKVADKVFAIAGWDEGGAARFTFKVSPMEFELLSNLPGLRPAPYFASRGMKWIQQFAEPGFTDDELRDAIERSYHLVLAGVSKKKREALGLIP